MKTEIDLRKNIAVIEGTPEEIARTLSRFYGEKDLNIEKPNLKRPAKLPARLFDTVEDTRLLDMKKSGASWTKIGQALNRSGNSVRARYAILKKHELLKSDKPPDKNVDIDKNFGEEFEAKGRTEKPESPEKKSGKDRPARPLKRPEWSKKKNIKRSYSDDENKQIATLYDAGKTDAQIAEVINRSQVAITNRLLIMRKAGMLGKRPPLADHKRGGNRRGRKPKAALKQKSNVSFSQDEDRQIRKLHKDGESPAQIAKLIGRDAIEVMAQLNNLGLE